MMSIDLASPRHRPFAASGFVVAYVVGWAALVRLADPSHWQPLLALGFGALLALAMVAETLAAMPRRRFGFTVGHSRKPAGRHGRASRDAPFSAALGIAAVVVANTIPGPHD